MPKYSIILPVYNAEKYIRDSVNTVLNNDYKDFEFIISNNCSTDGTEEFLNTIKDSRVKIIKPDKTLPLGAHWNFAIKHATGDWLWAMGADDGMLPYFFKICDKLIEICYKNNINIIKSNRAYFFWPGCEKEYVDKHIQFQLKSNLKIKHTSTIMHNMLNGKSSYTDIPQMYVSSLFSKKLIDKAISYSKTGEIIPYNVPAQDSYLGALACLFEEKYLYIDIPLGWVGTSPSSIGYLVKKNEIHYVDCSFSILSNKVLSMIFFMHLAFRAFYDNSTFKTKKFNRITSNIEILSRVYYQDLINLPFENNRVKTFFDYLSELNIDKNIIIKQAKKMKTKEKFFSLFNNLFNCKPLLFFNKTIDFFIKKFSKKIIESWSININNTCCFNYEQINSLLKSEEHVINILKKIQ